MSTCPMDVDGGEQDDSIQVTSDSELVDDSDPDPVFMSALMDSRAKRTLSVHY